MKDKTKTARAVVEEAKGKGRRISGKTDAKTAAEITKFFNSK